MQAERWPAENPGQWLRILAAQLAELANVVTEIERRQREREQTLQTVLTQMEALSSALRAVVPAAPAQQEPSDASGGTAPRLESGAPTTADGEQPPGDVRQQRQW